jgi:hypothetical protein
MQGRVVRSARAVAAKRRHSAFPDSGRRGRPCAHGQSPGLNLGQEKIFDKLLDDNCRLCYIVSTKVVSEAKGLGIRG